MRQIHAGWAFLSLGVALAVVPLGCSGDAEPGTVVADPDAAALPRSDSVKFSDEGDAPVAHGAAFPVAASECVITNSFQMRQPAVHGGDVTTVAYTRRSYDPERRIVSEIRVDNRGDPASLTANFYTLLDDAGLPRAYASELATSNGTGQRSFFRRDAHHNLSASLETYSDIAIDATPTESDGTWLSYSNEYDAGGRLVQHEAANRSVSLRFEHDEQGRCASAGDSFSIRRFEYDAEGRPAATHFDPVPGAGGLEEVRYSYAITQTYDEQGRLIASEQDGNGATAPDGIPDLLDLTSYPRDGSVIREHLDSPGVEAPRDAYGFPVGKSHRFEVLSPGCQDLADRLPSYHTQACSTG